MQYSGPGIVADGPAKVATATGAGTATGATLTAGYWLVVLGVLIALTGIAYLLYGSLRKAPAKTWK